MFYTHHLRSHEEPHTSVAPVLWSLAAILSIVAIAATIYIKVNMF